MSESTPDTITFDEFLQVDIRTGTILTAELNEKARKPAYVLTIDFGELGIKTSSAQLTQNYTPDDLVGKQIVAVVNFPTKRIAGVKSDVLVLGAVSEKDDVVLLEPTFKTDNGVRIS